jgi:hypothetical protein
VRLKAARGLKYAKVQIGAELLCKGGKVGPEYRLRSTECGKIAVQRWKAAFGLWKGAKMKRE